MDSYDTESEGACPHSPAKDAAHDEVIRRARDICLRLLTSRARTRAELAQALTQRGVTEEISDSVLDRLGKLGLVDDAAFAEEWVRSRHNYRGLARQALRAELRHKGIDDSLVDDALSMVDDTAERDKARQLIRKRLATLGDADDITKIRRLVGFLARRGYSEGMAYTIVREELS